VEEMDILGRLKIDALHKFRPTALFREVGEVGREMVRAKEELLTQREELRRMEQDLQQQEVVLIYEAGMSGLLDGRNEEERRRKREALLNAGVVLGEVGEDIREMVADYMKISEKVRRQREVVAQHDIEYQTALARYEVLTTQVRVFSGVARILGGE